MFPLGGGGFGFGFGFERPTPWFDHQRYHQTRLLHEGGRVFGIGVSSEGHVVDAQDVVPHLELGGSKDGSGVYFDDPQQLLVLLFVFLFV